MLTSRVEALTKPSNGRRNHYLMNAKRQIAGVYLDFSKAFDSVDIKMLLCKLEMYRIRGNILYLMSSYLKERKQCLFLNSKTLKFYEIKLGVSS